MRVSSTTNTEEVTDVLRLFVPHSFPRAAGVDAFSVTDVWLLPQKEQSLHPACTFSEECRHNVHKHHNIQSESAIPAIAHLVNYLGLFGELKLLWGKKSNNFTDI